MSLSKKELIKCAIDNLLTKSKTIKKAEKESTCYKCISEKICPYAWDLYNYNHDCLAEK
jgi:hypothetical protein